MLNRSLQSDGDQGKERSMVTPVGLAGFRHCLEEEPHPHDDLYLRELPVQLHPLGLGVAALDEPRPAVDVHQTPVIIVIDSGAQDTHVDLLAACVVHILGVKRRGENGQRSPVKEMQVKWL